MVAGGRAWSVVTRSSMIDVGVGDLLDVALPLAAGGRFRAGEATPVGREHLRPVGHEDMGEDVNRSLAVSRAA